MYTQISNLSVISVILCIIVCKCEIPHLIDMLEKVRKIHLKKVKKYRSTKT
jgi:hypothetical protein